MRWQRWRFFDRNLKYVDVASHAFARGCVIRVSVSEHEAGLSRFWLGEFFNRMERYGRYLTDAEKHGLEEASDTWPLFRIPH